jgi:hypothetical protein
MISSVTPRGTLYFKVLVGIGGLRDFIGMLEALLGDIEGKFLLEGYAISPRLEILWRPRVASPQVKS